MLYMIGLGLGDEKDISVKGLEAIKKCDKVYLESYTSKLDCSLKEMEEFYGKEVIPADREMVEKKAEDTILRYADIGDCAFLIIGDVFGATTHLDLLTRAREKGIDYRIINNASVLTAVGVVGLELYKYGKVTSIPFDNDNVKVPYHVLGNNKVMGLHTLFLLDLNPKEGKFMSIKEAIDFLLRIEKEQGKNVLSGSTLGIGCAHIGSKDKKIVAGRLSELREEDFGRAPYCLIIPGRMHFMEEEAIEFWR